MEQSRWGKALPPLLNMAARAGTLACKASLMLFMLRYFELESVGVYGLVAGMAVALPPMVGWGFNYWLNREVVGQPPLVAGRMIRDRLVLSLASCLLAGGVALIALLLGMPWPPHAALVAFILLLECLAFDLHLPLLGAGRAVLANVLAFVRNGVWMIPVMALGIVHAEYRTLEFLFWCWAAGLVVNIPLLWLALRRWPLRQIAKAPVEWRWMRANLRRGGLPYLSDIALVGIGYLDRYMVGYFLGLAMAGVFVLYWGLANAMYSLIQTGVMQLATPRLVALNRLDDKTAYWAFLRISVAKAAVIGVGLSLAMGMAMPWLLDEMGRQDMMPYMPLLWLLLGSMVLRAVADMLNFGLYSRHLDKWVPLLNIAGLVVGIGANIAGIALWGVWGSGMALGFVAVVLAGARLALLAREWKNDRAVKLL